MQALKRIGKPEDVADVVAFLASDKARRRLAVASLVFRETLPDCPTSIAFMRQSKRKGNLTSFSPTPASLNLLLSAKSTEEHFDRLFEHQCEGNAVHGTKGPSSHE
jgi:hypothetical protein